MRFLLIVSLAQMLFFSQGCKSQRGAEEFSGLKEATSLAPTQVEISAALDAKMAFWLNLDTNRMVMLENGLAVKSWNVATGDITGQFHKGEPNLTPTGIFNIHRLEICPPWNPQLKDSEGKPLPYPELKKQYEEKKDLYGSCGKSNPLGQFVMWFYKSYTYGLHGNNAEWILEDSSAENRRVSGGCVRNPNATIREVFLKVADFYSQSGAQGVAFKKFVSLELAKPSDIRANVVSEEMSFLGVKVIIGSFGKNEFKVGTRWDSKKEIQGNPQKPLPPKDPKDSETLDPSNNPDSNSVKKPTITLKTCLVTSHDPQQANMFTPVYPSPAPTIRHDYLWFATKGDTVKLLDSSGEWSKIDRSGEKGWVKSVFIKCSE